MNNWSKVSLSIFLLIGLMASSGYAQMKIAFIDLNRTFNEYAKTKDADTKLKERADEFNRERKVMMAKYEGMKTEIKALREEAQNDALSEDVQKEKRDVAVSKLVELREYESKIRTFDTTRKKELEGQSKRERERIIEEINGVLKTYAENQGFTMVVDSSGESLNQVPMIVYHNAQLDITDDILGIINAQEK